MDKKISLFKIYLLYIKIGALSFGGGQVLVPFLIEELGKKRKLVEENELIKMLAICQIIPGVFSVSASCYSGYLLRKLKGSIFAFLGVVTPSFILITLVYFLSESFLSNVYVNAFFIGVRIGVCFLLINASFKMYLRTSRSILDIILIIVVVALSLLIHLNTILIIISFIVIGYSIYVTDVSRYDKIV
ncbi:MAG: chromate transporter [Acholeplasmatales bacterium]|jgi:chromate transporter|nr:chromate transporter [Acholeplasmatales bacterium]